MFHGFANLATPLFPVLITEVSEDDPPLYGFVECWYDPETEEYAGKYDGGLFAEADSNPALPAVSSATFEVGDIALARSAAGTGGVAWELYPLSAGSTSTALTTDTARLAANANFTSNGVYVTLASLSVAAAGTYHFFGRVTAEVNATLAALSLAWVVADVSSGTLSDCSTTVLTANVSDTTTYGTGAFSFLATTTGAQTFTLRAARQAAGSVTWNTSRALAAGATGDLNGGTHFSYVKVG